MTKFNDFVDFFNLPEEEVFKALEAVENFAQPLAVVIDNKAYF